MGLLSQIPLENGLLNLPEVLQEDAAAQSQHYAVGWKAGYEIWTIDSQERVFHCCIDIPQEELQPLFHIAIFSRQWPKFHFPVAFSPDLQRVAILGCLVGTRTAYTGENLGCVSRCGDFDMQVIGLWDVIGFDINSVGVRIGMLYIYRLAFSPCGSFLLVVRGLDTIYRDSYMQGWVLELYSSYTNPEGLKLFEYLKTRRFFPAETAELDSFENCIVFHPSLPILALAQKDMCILWRFPADGE